ncbi:MAG TPA: hypothetical protein VMT91_15440, partial [Anaerolineales bacterium]|nr:hypothetical protein [Anaerolineales bacterium]
SYVSSAREQFDILDSKALSFLGNLNEDAIKVRLHQNQAAYTDNKPLQESVFLYFDLSTSLELLKYIVHLRSIIDNCIGTDNIRYSDVKLQHSTAFIDFLGDDLGIDSELLGRVKTEYEPIIKTLLPFNLTIVRPHIFETGGIVLEGTVYSQQFYKLREAASQKNSHFPVGLRRGIHKIIHSTIGYITDGTSKQLLELFRYFELMRKQVVNIPIRIRDIRIIATKNKRLVGQPIIIPFQGAQSFNQTERDMCFFLQTIKDLTPYWSNNNELKNFVLEEALLLVESTHGACAQRLAREIVDQS